MRGLTDLTGVTPNVTAPPIRSTSSRTPAPPSSARRRKKLTAAPGGGFVFPIIENPASLFGLLMGKDVTLVGYDMPAVDFSLSYSQFFPLIGPLGIDAGRHGGRCSWISRSASTPSARGNSRRAASSLRTSR